MQEMQFRTVSSTIRYGQHRSCTGVWGPHSFAAGRTNIVGFPVELHPNKSELVLHLDLRPTS